MSEGTHIHVSWLGAPTVTDNQKLPKQTLPFVNRILSNCMGRLGDAVNMSTRGSLKYFPYSQIDMIQLYKKIQEGFISYALIKKFSNS